MSCLLTPKFINKITKLIVLASPGQTYRDCVEVQSKIYSIKISKLKSKQKRKRGFEIGKLIK